MRPRLLPVLPLLLAALPLCAEKPWEMRVDLPLAVPVELPEVPATNPFAVALSSVPAPIATPLLEKLPTNLSVQMSAYVDATGVCRRVVPIAVPFPGIARELQTALMETSFSPGKSFGAATPTWLPVGFDLEGRIEQGRVLSLQVVLPDPAMPPVPEAVSVPAPEARDLALQAVLAEKLDVLPLPKRFRVSVDGREWRQEIRFLAEVGTSQRVSRVVFLACPDGLRGWLLRSLSRWTFSPATNAGGPVAAWVQVDLAIQVEISDQDSKALRVSRVTVYPAVAGAPSAAPLPGA